MAPDELLELDRTLQSLVEHPGWARLQEMLGKHRDAKVRALTVKVMSHEQYAHAAGSLNGLDAPRAVVELVHGYAVGLRERMLERERNRERDDD